MEQELKAIARKELIACRMMSMIVALILWGLFFIFVRDIALMLWVLAILIIASILLTIRKLKFIKNSHLTWGKIIKIEKSNTEDSDVWQEFIIEYIDGSTNETYKIKVYNHFGDNEEILKKDIQEFYEKGKKLLGKRVPLLYKTNEPNKTIAFFEKAE